MSDTLNITHAQASASILRHVAEGRLTQHQWHDRRNGQEIACLLGSIHPSVKSAAECNGELMPIWLAELTPTLFDGIAAKHIYLAARRYGKLVARWHVLSPAQWDAILTRFLIHCIDDAIAAARPVNEDKNYWPAVAAACEQVKAALVSGDADALNAASSTASSAARNVASSAAGVAWNAACAMGAADTASSAAKGAADTAESVARGAAGIVAWNAAKGASGTAESAARNAARCAAGKTRSAAYLSLFRFVLDQIEAECVSAEAA